MRELDDFSAAKRIYDDKVDILVDLMGHTSGSRLTICAFRPAPIQVSYLGFAATTGADFFDYLIADRIVAPETHAKYYSESLVYMPNSYYITDNSQTISNKKWTKGDFGLPEEGFVFCSFNGSYKIDSMMFDTWMNILRHHPKAVLWLLEENRFAVRNLKSEAEGRGIRFSRLVFSPKLPKDEHLARLMLADLVLDTRIVNGHTTTTDALWAGVPVITLKGSHLASRVSASCLTAIGLPELITNSLDEYKALAVRLVQDPDKLHDIRQKLLKNRLRESLFDTPRFVRNLEKAYIQMWEGYLAGEKPPQIEVVED